MAVVSGAIHISAVPVRIGTNIACAAVLVSVVAAGIAVGVIVSRQSGSTPFNRMETVFRSDVYIAIDRKITNNEYPAFYSASATLNDLIGSLNVQLNSSFPETSIQLVVSAFSNAPVLVSNANRKRQGNGSPSLVTLNGTAYFIRSYSSAELKAGFSNYSRTITLITSYGGSPSPGIGTFSSQYSIFTDTRSTNLTVSQADALVSISIRGNTTVSNTTVSPG